MCLAQGPQRNDAGEARRLEPPALQSRIKHSTTEPLRSLSLLWKKHKDQSDIKYFAKYFSQHLTNDVLISKENE